jgi:ATP adenylyltransferase
MLVVPRSREHFSGVSVNALGYAGSLFVRSTEGFEAVRRAGPLEVLAAVGERP